jgi:predicted nucleotidyltransferase
VDRPSRSLYPVAMAMSLPDPLPPKHDEAFNRFLKGYGDIQAGRSVSTEDARREPLHSELLTKCLEALRAREKELHARGVLHAAIFGSVARGDDNERSDVDVIVQVDPKIFPDFAALFDLEEEFSRDFGRSVDVVPMGGLKSPKHDGIRREMVMAF